ncbi:hypothetical protein OIE67_26500 [Nonomuraea fuscirosea]|uniref:hypothetical protein n=1 Tax=Nonomuraea fuscirosea TaxID=1291556 RepID=UPI002DD7D1C2|nr:hypothetical protein [Nonomuraea fuscirosea]WSA58047.1 hypothetical protein OIE67_26500 [Nonomuraea fuscirosea]
MDMRAEILDLKLRVDDLEITLEHGGELERQALLLHDIAERSLKLQEGIAELRARLDQGMMLAGEEFAAFGIEIAGVRREVSQPAVMESVEDIRIWIAGEVDAFRQQWRREMDFLRSETMDMNIKLDRLLKRTPWDT